LSAESVLQPGFAPRQLCWLSEKDKGSRAMQEECRHVYNQSFQAEKPSNMFRKPIVNFSMPWNWLFLPCHWIAINIVPGTVAM
jgi:hypothetical protein